MVGVKNLKIVFITLLGLLLLVKPSLGMAFSDIRIDDEDSFRNIQKLFKKRKQEFDEPAETTTHYRTVFCPRKMPPVLNSFVNTFLPLHSPETLSIQITSVSTPHSKVYLLLRQLRV